MKNIILIFVLTVSTYCSAQVGVNTTKPKAVLDIESEFLGIQFPRLTSEEILQIQNPEEGLMVYNVTKKCLAINIGVQTPDWKCLTVYEPAG